MKTHEETTRRFAPAALWLPGLLVALGAAVATAHGLYEVAHAAGAPAPIAGLYPLITDGLALVAYATTARLTGPGRRYAWTVVVVAAGLSGLAQASYLAGSLPAASGATPTPAPAVLRFGVGAWPAIAAAVVAHLLYLLATADRSDGTAATVDESARPADDRPVVQRSASVDRTAIHPDVERAATAPSSPAPVLPSVGHRSPPSSPSSEPAPRQPAPQPATTRTAASPARNRARSAAQRHELRHGSLPTVTQLMSLADVSRGTAGEALKDLRDRPAPLHVVHPDNEASSQR